MAAVSWTDQQRQAMTAQGRTILVSAAAGSGKTAVLTERIIEKIKNNPTADLSRMLIVTFTNAAAAELTARIGAKLTEALESDPSNKRLSKQLTGLPSAHISTIDSFCYEIVKRNYEKLGLPCQMRIADEAEISLLKKKLMNALFDDIYGGLVAFDDFVSFTEPFINDRDDSLPDLFISLYDQLSSYEQGIRSVQETAAAFLAQAELPFFENNCGGFVKRCLTSFIECFRPPVERARAYLDGFESKSVLRYAQEFENIARCLDEMEEALYLHDFESCRRAALSFSSVSLSGARLGGSEQDSFVKDTRNTFKKELDELRGRYFCCTQAQITENFRASAGMLEKLYGVLSLFEQSFTEEKIRRGILDYPDIERYALDLLQQNGKPSEFAKEYGARFDEIYIDEYQDINEVQDTIFRCIAGTASRFMVGDIKQSIYGFRGAAPDIFASYRERCPLYDPTAKQEAFTIFLSNNFRCSEPVVRFSNLLFSVMMNQTYGKINYRPEDNLVYSKKEENKVTAPVEITLIDRSKKNRSPISEEEYVAQKIKELIGQGYAPDDIVLLFRSPKKSAKRFEAALSALQIPCFDSESRDFFENPEVLLAMCLLNVIDNPHRDIYLAGALKSPVFGLTLDELAGLRRGADQSGASCPSLYDALLYAHEKEHNPKLTRFLTWLEEMRAFAKTKPVDKLLWHVYATTSLLSDAYNRAAQSGQGRRANLMMLYEHARRFEAGSFKGLYNFILYVEQIMSAEAKVEEAKTQSEAVSAVKMMSIHAAKGLEFKVCFVCACDYTPKTEESRDGILMAKDLGLGVFTPESTGLAKVNGIVRKTIAAKMETERLEEEMRVLYVALTRAKDRLFITASPQSAQTLIDKCRQNAGLYSKYTLLNCRNFISMMLTTLFYQKNDADWKLNTIGAQALGDTADGPQEFSKEGGAPIMTPALEICRADLAEKFSYHYAYEALCRLPSKLSVSKLYPGVLDEVDEQADESAPVYLLESPSFIEPCCKASPADRGTATHVFMQFCDFDRVIRFGIDAEIDRLIEQQFISRRYGDLIYRDRLCEFFSSPLFEEMSKAEELHRETRFNIKMPAAQFTKDEAKRDALTGESVFVQGVIDCFYITPSGGIKIIDYKTDTFTTEERQDVPHCADILRRRHEKQLAYYRVACQTLTGRQVEALSIYSFDLGIEIQI